MRSFIKDNPRSWAGLIPFACFSYNSSVNSSTGFSPFELVYGCKPNIHHSNSPLYTYDDYVSNLKIILDKTRAIAKANILDAKNRQKKIHDKKITNIELKNGDYVFMKNPPSGEGRKLQKKYKGPFLVKKILNEQNILIVENGREKVVHKNLVSKYNL